MRDTVAPALTAAAALIASAHANSHAQFVEPDTSIIHQFDGPSPGVGSNYGWGVAEIADLDGDAILDALIGEPFEPSTGFAGRTEVRSGATGALLLDLPGVAGFALGYAVADAGDANADGTTDILSGGPFAGGTAIVYSGADGSVLLTLAPPTPPAAFGTAVASAGDVNHDGHADLLVGEAFGGTGGLAYVFSGADGSLIRTLDAALPGALLGWGAANAGDIDGDHVDDHALGAPGASRAFVFSGADGTIIRELTSPSPNAGAFGQFFVDGLADTNADQVRDIYVGDFAVDSDPNDAVPPEGEAYIYSGADGSLLHTFTGAPGDGIGPGRGAGDHDNDGCEDLAIGGYTASAGNPGAGQITLFSGFDATVLKTYTYTVSGANLGFDCVGIGDTNADGSLDILGSGATGDVVFILSGDPRPCAADVNRDGHANILDFIDILRAFHHTYNRFADLDHNGVINIYDIAEWLHARRECG